MKSKLKGKKIFISKRWEIYAGIQQCLQKLTAFLYKWFRSCGQFVLDPNNWQFHIDKIVLGSLCNGKWAKSSNPAFTGIYWKSHFRILQNQNYHVYKFQCTKGNTKLVGKPFNVALLLSNVIFKWIDFWLVHYHLSSTAFPFQPFDKTRTHIHQQDITNTSTISKMFFNQKSLSQILWLTYVSLVISFPAFGITMDWTQP